MYINTKRALPVVYLKKIHVNKARGSITLCMPFKKTLLVHFGFDFLPYDLL